MAEQRRDAHIFDDLLKRHLQLFLILAFVIAELSDVAQIVDGFAGFAGDFVELRLGDAEAQQEMVYPACQRVGAIKDRDIVAVRQPELEQKTVILQRIAGGGVQLTQRLSELLAERQPSLVRSCSSGCQLLS